MLFVAWCYKEPKMEKIVKLYFELRAQFPTMSPSSCWFFAGVEADIREAHSL